MSLVDPGISLVVVATLLVLVAAGVARVAALGVELAVLTATARAGIQLTIVALVIASVLSSEQLSLLFVLGMLIAAAFAAAQRIAGWRGAPWAGLAVAGGAVPVLTLILASGVVPFSGPAIVAVSGIVIGGAMTATGQAGRRALDELRARAGEFEAALALGLDRRAAGLEIVRPSAAQALFRPLDQARTAGLVTLPGAFIGVLLGGGSAGDAASAQILVLFAVVAAEVIAVALALELVVRGQLVRAVRGERAGTARAPR